MLAAGGGAWLLLTRPAAAADRSDAELLEGLLERERRLESAYAAALAEGAIDAEPGRSLLGHEREHVRALEQSLRNRGRRVPDRSAASPAAARAGRRAFARFALDLEAATVAAYEEALALLRDERLLQPLGSIMSAGAQHEVALRAVLGLRLLPVR